MAKCSKCITKCEKCGGDAGLGSSLLAMVAICAAVAWFAGYVPEFQRWTFVQRVAGMSALRFVLGRPAK